MPKEVKSEPGEVHPKYWEKTVKEAFKNDPFRIIIELIKNAADSYTRAEKKGLLKPPFDIIISILEQKKKPPKIIIKEFAEGMDSEKLKEALKYGAQTSMGEDLEAITSAEKGIGLKDALMALKNNWLVTIKDGKINERRKHPDFKTGFGKEDVDVTDKERKEIGIVDNGTIIEGELPNYFKYRQSDTIHKHLKKHFLLRKLLQNPKFKVYIEDNLTLKKKILRYKPPNIEAELVSKEYKIDYGSDKYIVSLEINKSEESLDFGKPFGSAGILFYYGDYTVVDLSLGLFEKDVAFSKLFGEAKLGVEKLIRNSEEAPLVDEKRRGLDHDQPFNIKLFKLINNILKDLREEEEESIYKFDNKKKKEIITEANKLYKTVKGKGLPPTPKIKPELFEFASPYYTLEEYEPKYALLIVNSKIESDDLEIVLKSNNHFIEVKPKILRFKNNSQDEFIYKQVILYSEKPGEIGEITATSNSPAYSTKIGIQVLENPIFSPDDGFSFVPDDTKIVEKGEKKVSLCIDKSIISSKDIKISSEGPINCAGHWTLPDKNNLNGFLVKNVLKVDLPIKVLDQGVTGDNAIVRAKYEDKECDLTVKIINNPSISGLLRDIKLSSKIAKRISYFDQTTGILEIFIKHPLLKKYMSKKDFNSRPDFLVFVSDIISRELINAFVHAGINESSSRFPIFDLENPDPEIEDHITKEYYENGPLMHAMFVRLAKTFCL